MIVNWASGVNTKILRNGTSWSEVQKYIQDQTRSGKIKRRMYHSQAKKTFSVKMRFTPTEYETFKVWFEDTLMNGLYDFNFKQIDQYGHTTDKVYRFSTVPQYNAVSGNNIEVSMEWLEL